MEAIHQIPSNFWSKHHKPLIEIIAFLFVMLFAFAEATKLMEENRFYNNLNNSPILGGKIMATILTWSIPTLEIMIGFFVAWPRTRLKGLYGALRLMILFTLYVAGIVFLAHTPCSCGGVITLLSWP